MSVIANPCKRVSNGLSGIDLIDLPAFHKFYGEMAILIMAWIRSELRSTIEDLGLVECVSW